MKKPSPARSRTKLHLFLAGSVLSTAALARYAVADGSPAASASTGSTPHGAQLLRILGPRAANVYAPTTGRPGALVKLPEGTSAASLGLTAAAPGYARLQGTPNELLRFADAHPDLPFELGPTLHPLMNHAGVWTRAISARSTRNVDGTGVLVGVADTGLDVTHPEMRDASGKTRVAWLLDLSLAPIGKYPDLEKQFGVLDSNGNVVSGAVFDADTINDRLFNYTGTLPSDESGHGTHVTSIAAGNGKTYTGIAPGAGIVFVRVTRDSTETIENDDLVRAAGFIFNRADAEKKPIAVNFSLGTDFGPHDGTMSFETVLASYVGPNFPGRALVVAAGNSGSISETPIHQSVHVAPDAPSEVTLVSPQGAKNGTVQIWATFEKGAAIEVGLKAPGGDVWVPPTSPGQMFGTNGGGYTAGVVNGSSVAMSPVPSGSNGAVIVWNGAWPGGTYAVTLQGHEGSSGTVDLYMETAGDVAQGAAGYFAFESGVREGTINLPATEPSIIGVGCTANRPSWTSITGVTSSLHVPVLDATGTSFAGTTRALADGEICWFSSAGPTETGVPKPDIAAPGGLVVAAMSVDAQPGGAESIFTTPDCPAQPGASADPRCLQVDGTHAVAVGTSMSAPMVAGAAALLFQQDPTITQDKLMTVLQAGAHHFRGADPFDDQGGPGELDVEGAFDALAVIASDAAGATTATLPSAATSWMTLSRSYVPADGASPMKAILELRTADGSRRADLFSASRLAAYASIDGQMITAPSVTRVGPGLYTFSATIPAGHGGGKLTVGATFDGADIVSAKTVPISSDIWTAYDPIGARGGCAITGSANSRQNTLYEAATALLLVLGVTLTRRRA